MKKIMNQRVFTMLGIFMFIFGELFVSDVFAYIDPGTGSMILQSLIGVLVGAGIILRVYWTKIKFVILDRKSKKDN
jgi:hypothetical protein